MGRSLTAESRAVSVDSPAAVCYHAGLEPGAEGFRALLFLPFAAL